MGIFHAQCDISAYFMAVIIWLGSCGI